MTRPSCAWNFQRERERFKHLVEELTTDPISSDWRVVVPTCFPERPISNMQLESLSQKYLSVVRFGKCNTASVDDNQFTVLFKDESGQTITVPKLLPNFCEDERLEMSREQHIISQPVERKLNSVDFVSVFLECIEKENAYYHKYLAELIRQETVQCYERGKLLADIRMFYKNFIESLLIRFSNLYTELFCQELLCQQVSCLNKKYINETNSIVRRMQTITENNEVYKSEEKQLETKFKSKLSEVSMKEYLLNEFKHCYEYQRKFSQNRLEDLRSDYKLWNNTLKLLNYHVFSQLSISHESNMSNLAQICFDLQQTIEIWGFIGVWLVESLKLYDTIIMSKIGKLIQNDWHIHVESVIRELNARDEECELHIQKINSLLKSLDECFQQNRSVDDLLRLLGDLLQTNNECLDLFNGECILNIKEKLVQIEHIQINWFEMFYESSHYDELMSDDSINHEKEMTIELQKELKSLLHNSRIHLHGEDGIVQFLTKFIRSIEDFIQLIQVNTTDNENEKIFNNYVTSELQNKISNNVVQHNQKLWQRYFNCWMIIMKNILNCQCQTYNNELKEICILDSMNEECSKSDQCTIVFDEFNQMKVKLGINSLKCQQNSIKWFELMKCRVECINEMRIQQITFEQIDTLHQLTALITENNVNKQQNTSNEYKFNFQNEQFNEDELIAKKYNFYRLTKSLMKLGRSVVNRLNHENIDGYYDRRKVLFRLNSFNLYAEKWIEHLQATEKFNVTQTFKNVKDYLNTHSTSKHYTDISNQSIIRYLQTKDWTIRESFLADIHDGQPVQNMNDKEFTVELPKHLLQTNLASLALLKQYEYTQVIGKMETETIDCEKETLLLEIQLTSLCNTIEFLKQQLNVKQDELKSLEDILHIKLEVINEQL
ncbi:hypothetical protein MN116_000156 [Schistosoma mekongi]|uniref:Axonemal dynein light chain domain-containing protein 1 n=1 Tax=Schistosoma mekongi TaxID=38744 RepID=A0AAE1Z8X1_SCHME|nr:hypothetical protein MN116_000156 [Schistosoma mekongi]